MRRVRDKGERSLSLAGKRPELANPGRPTPPPRESTVKNTRREYGGEEEHKKKRLGGKSDFIGLYRKNNLKKQKLNLPTDTEKYNEFSDSDSYFTRRARTASLARALVQRALLLKFFYADEVTLTPGSKAGLPFHTSSLAAENGETSMQVSCPSANSARTLPISGPNLKALPLAPVNTVI